MSGAKLSEAELRKQEQERLEKERQERLRKIKEATDEYSRLITQYEAFRVNVSLAMKKELETFGSVGELRLACDSFISVKLSLDSEIGKRLSWQMPIEPEDIQALNSKLQDNLSSLENSYSKGLSAFADRLSLYREGQAELAKSKEFAAALSKIEKEKRLEYSNTSFDLSALLDSKVDAETDADVNALYDDVITECAFLANDSAIGRDMRSQLLGIVDELQKNQESKAACNAATFQYKSIRGNAKKNIRVFNELYAQYCALYTEWRGLWADKKNPLAPMPPKHKFESVRDLENEILLLDEKIKTEIKRAYIREQIDEVMQIFGYDTAEPIVLRGATKGQSYLFESDNSAIHLFVSDTNKIMFEPVGLDNLEGDEHAGYDGMVADGVSDADRKAIYEDQVEFCSLHPKMTEELKKRGVLLGNTKIKEAGEKAKLLNVKGKQTKRKKTEHHDWHYHSEEKQREVKIN